MRQRVEEVLAKEGQRLLMIAAMAFMSGALVFSGTGFAPFWGGVFYLSVILPAACLVVLMFPSQAALVEAMAIARFGLALVIAVMPAAQQVALGHPELKGALVLICGIGVHLMLQRLRIARGPLGP